MARFVGCGRQSDRGEKKESAERGERRMEVLREEGDECGKAG